MLQTQAILNSKLLAMAGLIHFWQKKIFAVMRKIRFFHAIDYHHSFISLDHNFLPQKHHWLWKLNPGEVTSRLFENVDIVETNILLLHQTELGTTLATWKIYQYFLYLTNLYETANVLSVQMLLGCITARSVYIFWPQYWFGLYTKCNKNLQFTPIPSEQKSTTKKVQNI